MRLKKLLLPIGLFIIIGFSQCALLAVGAGVGFISSKAKSPRPNFNPNEVDTVWVEETIEDVAVEEAVEEAIEEAVEEAPESQEKEEESDSE